MLERALDYDWTAEHVAFRTRIQDFLADQLPSDWLQKSKLDASEPYVVEVARWLCPELARSGLLIPHWPKKLGGEGLDAFHHLILGEEMRAIGEPRAYQYMNVNWIGPAIIQFGSQAQIDHHIRLITEGRVFWCQGFSEPSAGSDLAAMQTRAERTSDGWRINGSKIWTSGAGVADYCFLLARTGQERRDISAFIIPMNTPGVKASLVPSVAGARSLYEVFFTDVDVPEDALLGDQDKGWALMRQVLHNERIGSPRTALSLRGLERCVSILKEQDRFSDPATMERAVRARVACEGALCQIMEVVDRRVKGLPPTAQTSLARYAMVLGDKALSQFIGDCLHNVAIGDEDPVVAAAYRRSATIGITAGTAEIQLNAIARDHLDLPRDQPSTRAA